MDDIARAAQAATDQLPFLHQWDDVVSLEECRRLIAQMQTSTKTEGLVLRGGTETLETATRACSVHLMPKETSEFVLSLLSGLGNKILERFHLPPCRVDGPYFVSYGPGEFFKLHQDTAYHHDTPKHVAERLLTVVLYLNGRDTGDAAPSFDGGALAVYDPARPGLSGRHIVAPKGGVAVAFRSHCFHEVLPVREGVRYAVLFWFLESSLTTEKE